MALFSFEAQKGNHDMIERDLQAASDLLGLIKYTESSITIAKADAVSLRICYDTPPFQDEGGKTFTKVNAASALGVDPEEMRVVVHEAIIKHLESKIAFYRANLAKLGVKLDEPPPTIEEAKTAVKRGKATAKKLAAPKKQLRLKGPDAPALRAVE